MKICVVVLCIALHMLGVVGFRAPGLVRRSSRRLSGTWSCAASPNLGGYRRTFSPARVARGVAPAAAPATTATMKLEVEATADQADGDPYSSALTNTALAVSGAIAFGAGINQFMGAEKAVQFFAGYVVELSLSVDNLFVFLLLFDFFKVPLPYQHRVLSWGILGAVVMRALFIAAGEAAMSIFHPVLLGFAGVLLFSAYKLWTEEEDEDEDLTENAIVAFASKSLNSVDFYDGDNFFTTVDGIRRATPLLLVLVCIELSDVVFAVDSIPAVFAVTKDPFIVYTSNMWAILNLRSLFTLLANAVEDLAYLRPAVAVVLAFVGAKLGGEFFSFDISTELSLGIITAILGSGIGLSLMSSRNK